jgi:hypothetical protein
MVLDGTKDRTIRAERKRPIKVGDSLSLRRWTGRPYMSKQEVLIEAVCIEIAKVLLEPCGDRLHIRLNGDWIHEHSAVDAFAGADGFRSGTDMRAWFQSVHGLPFTGTMIRWKKTFDQVWRDAQRTVAPLVERERRGEVHMPPVVR